MDDAGQPDLTDFEDFVRAVRARLFRAAYRLCGDWYEADDLTQITLERLQARWPAMTRRRELWSYTRVTLQNVYFAEHRRARWRHEVSRPEFPDLRPVAGLPDVESSLLLRTALRRLGPGQRAVLALRFWQDLSVQATAQILACSVGNVTSQTNRALHTLRTLLAADRRAA
jgi:RNA polymerase sigma factor (sigma-70 family)